MVDFRLESELQQQNCSDIKIINEQGKENSDLNKYKEWINGQFSVWDVS